MKRNLFSIILAAMLLMIINVKAQETNDSEQSKLKGVWQMCFYVSEMPNIPGELKPGNTFKILSEDGHITNFTMIPNKGAIITGYGTYSLTSDSTYCESIERSIHLPMLNNKDNILQFEFVEGNYMRLKFYIATDEEGNQVDTWYHETWRKLDMPNKYPRGLVR